MPDAFDRLRDDKRDPASSAVLLDHALIAAQSAPSCSEAEISEAMVAYGDARSKETKTTARIREDRAEIERLRALLSSHGIEDAQEGR